MVFSLEIKMYLLLLQLRSFEVQQESKAPVVTDCVNVRKLMWAQIISLYWRAFYILQFMLLYIWILFLLKYFNFLVCQAWLEYVTYCTLIKFANIFSSPAWKGVLPKRAALHKHAWRETKTLFYKSRGWDFCSSKLTVSSEHLLHTNVIFFSRSRGYCLYKIIKCCLCQWFVQRHVEEELLEEKEKRIEELEKEVLNIYIYCRWSTVQFTYLNGVIW